MQLGDEIYPEDKIWQWYLKLREKPGTIYIPQSMGYSMSGDKLALELLKKEHWMGRVPGQYYGYDLYENYYTVVVNQNTVDDYSDTEDWWGMLDV